MNLGRFLHLRLQGASVDTPIANDLFGSKQGGTTQTVQSNAPWGPAQGYMQDIFEKGNKLSQNYYQAPETLQAQQLQSQRALAGSPLTQAAQDQNLSTIRGDYTNLATNPAAQSAMDMAKSKINSQFSGDNYGNSAHQEWLGKGLMSAASPFYESERGRQMQATALAPSLAANDYADIGLLGQVGAQKEAFPWNNLFNYQKSIAGFGGQGGTSTQQQPYYTNPLGQAAGLGTLGYMVGGPWGAGIGAGLGLLGGG